MTPIMVNNHVDGKLLYNREMLRIEKGKYLLIQGSIAEFSGMVSDGLIYAAILQNGAIWARKTTLPTRQSDIAEIRRTANLPADIQAMLDAINPDIWPYGSDVFFDVVTGERI